MSSSSIGMRMPSSTSRPTSRSENRSSSNLVSTPIHRHVGLPPVYYTASKVHLQSHNLHLVLSEITSVTSVIRNTTRWSSSSYAALNGLTSYSYSAASVPTSSSTTSANHGLSTSMGLRSQNKANPTGSNRPAFPFSLDNKGEDGISLLSAFSVLRAQLRECYNLSSFPLHMLLSPFLRVILSPRTTGLVTSYALKAVQKFLVYGIVCPSAPGAQVAIAEIAHATSHCRFEAYDASTDEIVLLRILAVMQQVICEPAQPVPDLSDLQLQDGFHPRPHALADFLSDDSICEMMETGLSMCCQMRLSDNLRRTAEQAITTMMRSLFTRLSSIPTVADEFFSSGSDAPKQQPEHATLAAEPEIQEQDLDSKKRRRMTMPDPTSQAFPAAAVQALKDIQESDQEESAQEEPAQEESAQEEPATLNDNPTEEAAQPLLQPDTTTQQSVTSTVSLLEPTDGQSVEQKQAEEIDPSTLHVALDVEPYGLPAVKEVFRVVISLLDPAKPQNTETMKMLGISLLTSIFETAGRSIGRFPSLRVLVQDSACKHLFTLSRSENVGLLYLVLRCISTMFESLRQHLKLQHELFLTLLMDRLAPTFPLSQEPWNDRVFDKGSKKSGSLNDPLARSATSDTSAAQPPPPPPAPPLPKSSERAPVQGEARELLLETMSLLFRTFASDSPSDYLVDLWANYDCDIDCENLCERLIHFLCRSVHASNPQHPHHQDSSQLFALDALLSFVGEMANRQEFSRGADASGSSLPIQLSYQTLSDQKGRKAAILAGAAKFNAKPKDGLAYLEKQGLLDTFSPADYTRPQRIAKFLKECPRLDKKLLGEYIAKPDNSDILEAFMSLFDFKDKPIAEALRELLESFRLPGEAQQIDRITQTFAKAFFAAEPQGISTEDAVYVLAFSVIMLNTDLHNPQNKRRMLLDDYRRNLRGVNSGQDFDTEYLALIYDSIRRREIVMPEEHAGQLGFDYTWKELLRKSTTAGNLYECPTSAFDREIFQVSWKPIFSSIAFAFSTFRDEYMVERAISGIRQCAILASNFEMLEIFDFMVHSLASATGLLDGSVPEAPSNSPTVEIESQTITVSPLSIRFGFNFKGQLAAVVLFTIANGNVNAIRTGWSDIFEIFKNLFAHTMLPPSMLQMEDISDGQVSIPMKPPKMHGPVPADPRSQGLFSTLSSYLLITYSSSSEPAAYEATEEDVEAAMSSVDCITSCKIEDLYNQIRNLGSDSLLYATQALKELADSLTVQRLAAAASTPDGSAAPALGYDPKAIFVLEMMVVIATSDRERVADTWPIVTDHITAVLHNAKNCHPMVVEREVAALLRLVNATADCEELRDQLFLSLDLLRTLSVQTRISGSKQLLAGLKTILKFHPKFARSPTEWGLVFALISDNANMRSADAARLAFEATEMAIVGGSVGNEEQEAALAERLTAVNFSLAVSILTKFSSGADTTAWRNMLHRESPQRRTTLTEQKEMAEVEKVQTERGLQAIQVLERLKGQVPRLIKESSLKEEEAWKTYWVALLCGIAKQWTNPHSGLRQSAITLLQRALLAPELLSSSSSSQLSVLFQEVLFPLLEELLKLQVYQLDPTTNPGGMLETRIRACALVCKTFLYLLVRLSENPTTELQQLWLNILDFMDRLMASSGITNGGGVGGGGLGNVASTNGHKRSLLTEAIPENLKNVLLVMSASHLLLPPPTPHGIQDNRTPNQAAMYAVSYDRIQRFLPGLMEEVFPTKDLSSDSSSPSQPGLTIDSTEPVSSSSNTELVTTTQPSTTTDPSPIATQDEPLIQ